MKFMRRQLVLLLLCFAPQAYALEPMLMVRVNEDFPEAMSALQNAISEYGYTVSRVQHVDVGLTTFGFQTDKYRIVFFAKPEEQRELVARYPQLIPYLPLKFTLFAEEDDTLVVGLDPTHLNALVEDEETRYRFIRWSNDMQAILQELRER